MKTLLAFVALSFFFLLPSDDSSASPSPEYQNGDVNLDGQICMDDPVFIIYHLYRDGRPLPCPSVADADRDGSVAITDVVVLLKYIFNGEYLFDCPIPCGPLFPPASEYNGYAQ